MPTNDAYILALRSTFNSVPIVNTFAIRQLTAPDPVNADFLDIANTIKNSLRTCQVDDLAYVDWVAHQVRGAGTTYNTTPPFQVSTVSFSGAFTGTLTGALTGEPETQMAAALMRLNTTQSGRRRKGRVFVCGLAIADVTDAGVLSSTALGLLTTSASFIDGVYGIGGTNTFWRLGVWSSRTATNAAYNNVYPRQLVSQGAPSPTTAFADVDSITVAPFVASQRDRRPGI